MFRFFINPGGMSMQDLSDLHPSILEALLERCWNFRINVTNVQTIQPGHPDRRSDVPGRHDLLLNPTLAFNVPRILPRTGDIDVRALDAVIRGTPPPPPAPQPPGRIRSHHWSYAYMIENTRAPEVFRRVVDGF